MVRCAVWKAWVCLIIVGICEVPWVLGKIVNYVIWHGVKVHPKNNLQKMNEFVYMCLNVFLIWCMQFTHIIIARIFLLWSIKFYWPEEKNIIDLNKIFIDLNKIHKKLLRMKLTLYGGYTTSKNKIVYVLFWLLKLLMRRNRSKNGKKEQMTISNNFFWGNAIT